MNLVRPIAMALCALLPGLAAAQAPASEDPPPHWPCEQILVPRIAAAVVWDGPAAEGLAWRDNAQVAALVAQITPGSVAPAQAESAIAAFAVALSPQEKDPMLALAFAGVLETLNQDRAILIDGIARYARDQQRRAEALGLELDRMVQLEKDDSPAAAAERAALKDRLTLEERAFDERERAIPFLCARPVAVEQRLGFLARTLSGYLD